MNLFQWMGRFSQVLERPFSIGWTPYTLKCMLGSLLLYGCGIALYYSSRENRRPGEEYGSAKWGNPKELNRKYMDHQHKDANIILTQRVRLGMDGYITQRNMNVLVVGGSGSGKTRFFCKPNIYSANCSYLITDPKGGATRSYPQTRAAEESGSFLEQDSTAVPKFAFRSFCPCGNLVGECLPQTLLMRLAPLKNPSKYFFGFFKNSSASHPVFLLLVRGHHAQKGGFTMRKRYNTPHRSRVVKTRMTEEEYAEFAQRLSAYNMSQAEFIRQAITGAAIRPIITVSPVNDELLAAVGKLTAEYGRIGGNLNQIARTLNEWHSPYPQLAGEVRAAVSDLAALKFEVLQKVGDAVGNIQTYQL